MKVVYLGHNKQPTKGKTMNAQDLLNLIEETAHIDGAYCFELRVTGDKVCCECDEATANLIKQQFAQYKNQIIFAY